MLLCDEAECPDGPGLEALLREGPGRDAPAPDENPDEKELFDEEKLLLDEELCDDEWDLDELELWLEWDELLL